MSAPAPSPASAAPSRPPVVMKWMIPSAVDSSTLPSQEEQDKLYKEAVKDLRNIDHEEINRRYIVGSIGALLLMGVYYLTRTNSSTLRTVLCAPLVYATVLSLASAKSGI